MENFALDEQGAMTSQVPNLPYPCNATESAPDVVQHEAHFKDLGAMTAASRLSMLAGAGSIGKLHLAVALARRTMPTVANDASGAQFERVSESGIVTTMVAPASGADSVSNSLERMAASLDSRRLLHLLDSCEHIIDTVTSVAEALVQANARL
jgi:predicted ATPase